MKKTTNWNTNSNKSSIDSIINDSLLNLKQIIDTNTVVGEEIETSDGTVIVPISKIIVGFVAGGGDYVKPDTKNCQPFAGGTGAGFTVVPIGFLAGKQGNLTFVSTKQETQYDDLIHLTNKALGLLINSMSTKNKEHK